MATVSTPVLAWVSALLAGAGLGQSSSLTVTVNITGAWEIHIPAAIQYTANISADALVNVYPSMDGGVTYDNNPITSFALPRISSGLSKSSIRLSTGQYALQILNSGPHTATVYFNTSEVLTAINNV